MKGNYYLTMAGAVKSNQKKSSVATKYKETHQTRCKTPEKESKKPPFRFGKVTYDDPIYLRGSKSTSNYINGLVINGVSNLQPANSTDKNNSQCGKKTSGLTPKTTSNRHVPKTRTPIQKVVGVQSQWSCCGFKDNRGSSSIKPSNATRSERPLTVRPFLAASVDTSLNNIRNSNGVCADKDEEQVRPKERSINEIRVSRVSAFPIDLNKSFQNQTGNGNNQDKTNCRNCSESTGTTQRPLVKKKSKRIPCRKITYVSELDRKIRDKFRKKGPNISKVNGSCRKESPESPEEVTPYNKGTGNDKQGKDAGNRALCPYRNFSQAITYSKDWTRANPATPKNKMRLSGGEAIVDHDKACRPTTVVKSAGAGNMFRKQNGDIASSPDKQFHPRPETKSSSSHGNLTKQNGNIPGSPDSTLRSTVVTKSLGSVKKQNGGRVGSPVKTFRLTLGAKSIYSQDTLKRQNDVIAGSPDKTSFPNLGTKWTSSCTSDKKQCNGDIIRSPDKTSEKASHSTLKTKSASNHMNVRVMNGTVGKTCWQESDSITSNHDMKMIVKTETASADHTIAFDLQQNRRVKSAPVIISPVKVAEVESYLVRNGLFPKAFISKNNMNPGQKDNKGDTEESRETNNKTKLSRSGGRSLKRIGRQTRAKDADQNGILQTATDKSTSTQVCIFVYLHTTD